VNAIAIDLMVNSQSEQNKSMPSATAAGSRSAAADRGSAVLGSSGRANRMKASFAKRLGGYQALEHREQIQPGRALPRRSGRSLAENLVVLVAVVALPLIVLGTGALWLQYRSARVAAEMQLVAQARSTALLVDREFERTLAVAQTLAAAVPVAQGDLNALEAEYRAAKDVLATTLPPEARPPILSLMDANGDWLLHTEWAPGERRTGLHGTPFGLAAIVEGRPKISDLFISPSAHVPLVGLAVPIFALKPNGDGHRDVIGGVGICVPRERLIAIVREAGLPSGAVASVLDRKGVIVARSLGDAETLGALPTQAELKAITASPAGLVPPESTTLGNVASTIAFAHAPYTGYTLKIDVPEEVFLAPLRESLYRSAATGISVFVAGLALALFLAGGIVRAFRLALGTAVKGAMPVPETAKSAGLREADDLAALLATAIAEREQAAGDARALLDNSPIGIIIFDTGGSVLTANDAFLSLVGHTRAEMSEGAFQWDEMTPEQWVVRDEAAFAETIANGRCTPYEKEYLRSDGTAVPVLVSLGLTDRGRGLAAGFVMDLTEQRRHETAHREAEDQLRFCLTAGSLGAWNYDLTTQTMRCSELTHALYGKSKDKIVALSEIIAVLHDDDRDNVQDAIRHAIATREDFQVEYRVIWPDDSVHWLGVRGRVIQAAGEPARLAGVTFDITERKHAEAALRESATWLRAITDTMPQFVWSARPDGYHDYYNQRWYDLTGTTPEQAEGEGWNPIGHPDDQARVLERWQHSLATGEPYEVEYRLRMADGSYRWMLSRALPVRDPETGEILRWFGTCTDIEETVAARETQARSREELEQLVAERTKDLQATQVRLAQAQRMEALGQLAGGIAHDFNNVLQAVQGGGALLERNPTDADGVRRHSRMILEATERGGAITRRLLAFSRRGDLRAESVDPAMLQSSIRDILSHTLGDGVKVGIELAPNLPPLFADKGQLETVLINLATNGRDAMAGIGTLTLAANAETVRPDQVPDHRGGLKAGSYVRLSVSDTGTGMDAKTLARASEPFFTTKPTGKGTGLGLAMARGFAEQSGGGFHIASAPGRGTTVTLWFPVAEAGLPAAGVPAEHAAPILAWHERPRLLLVDDDEIVREVTAELMEATGFAVLSAESAAAAIALLDDNQDVDILVSDLSMPDMDGVTLIREAQRRRPGLPAILLTGFATNAAEIAVGGAFSLVRKPVKGEHLAERVAALLETASAGR
jgi:PAS domain S-box-containing protein